MCFKNFERKSKRESPKRILSASDGLERLEMVLEANTGHCVSEDVGP